jgi:AcrR family transcriptional regulator
MSTSISTEEKMKAAAKLVFIAKGFSGCTSREIAKEAGMNVALVNYYFRSKNKLFQLIFQAVMDEFFESMVSVFSSDLSIKDKLKILIEREYDFLSKYPEIPRFIINELSRKNNDVLTVTHILPKIYDTGVITQALEAQKKGEMRKLDMVGITLLVISNCQYPFMAKPLIQNLHSLSDEQYIKHLDGYKVLVSEMIINYLFPTDIKNELK